MESAGSRFMICVPISQPSSKSLTYATTLELLGFASLNTIENVKNEKLKSSPLSFQPVLPSSQEITARSAVICPPTPPSKSPPHHLLQSPSLERSGSDSVSSVDKFGHKLMAGGTMPSAAAMTRVVDYASPNLVARRQACRSTTCTASGSIASSSQEKEFASTTTFVQTDTSSFRELVQKLTGASVSDLPITVPSRQAAKVAVESSGTRKLDNTCGGLIPKPVVDLSVRRSSFKLHERRQSNLRKLEIKGLRAAAVFKRGVANFGGSELLSLSNQKVSLPSSPVSPLTADVFEKAYAPRTPTSYEGHTGLKSRSQSLEEEKGKDAAHFFLHPATPSLDHTRPQPELLTLFPLVSPRASET